MEIITSLYKRGFSLLELLVVLSLCSIFVLMVVPLGNEFITRHRVQAQVQQLLQLLQFARNEALAKNVPVSLCSSHDGQQCNGVWSEGQILFIDRDRTGQVKVTEDILAIITPHQTIDIYWQGFLSNDFLRIEPLIQQRATAGTFSICPNQHTQKYAQAIVISRTGRARVMNEGVSCF